MMLWMENLWINDYTWSLFFNQINIDHNPRLGALSDQIWSGSILLVAINSFAFNILYPGLELCDLPWICAWKTRRILTLIKYYLSQSLGERARGSQRVDKQGSGQEKQYLAAEGWDYDGAGEEGICAGEAERACHLLCGCHEKLFWGPCEKEKGRGRKERDNCPKCQSSYSSVFSVPCRSPCLCGGKVRFWGEARGDDQGGDHQGNRVHTTDQIQE